ncbi:MAG: chemotaxis protein CheB [Rhodanobacter sp.]
MSDSITAVALLFDDAELGGHLRAALCEHGARIVHEGTLSGLDHAQLRAAGAEVVVVNLDDESGEAALDNLYELVESGQPRVVFNDAQASRSLDGWDRARWARHLALKALSVGDVDPPRPLDARAIEFVPASPEPAPVELASIDAVHAEMPVEALHETFIDAPIDDAPMEHMPVEASFASIVDDIALPTTPLEVQHAAAESETLAAELEALLAADEQHPAEHSAESEVFGTGLKYDADAELPPLHDGDFGSAPGHGFDGELDYVSSESALLEIDIPPAITSTTVATSMPAFQTDHLVLASLDDEWAMHADVIVPEASVAVVAPTAPSAWSLLDDDEILPPVTEPARHEASHFGIQKMSAADFLAPNVEEGDAPTIEPGLSLELVSIEEAIAPTHYEPTEVRLDELDSALGRLVVLGAARDGVTSLCTFLASLPKDLRLLLLLTQHLAGQSMADVLETLATHSALPVQIATTGQRAKPGVVLLVPDGQQLRLLRDGRVELQAVDSGVAQGVSIDASFTMAANVFGRDALGIVFAGKATDAVAGSQAIHDRGGQVWVELSDGEQYSDMVHGVLAERLASFSGTPQELAARLSEDYR